MATKKGKPEKKRKSEEEMSTTAPPVMAEAAVAETTQPAAEESGEAAPCEENLPPFPEPVHEVPILTNLIVACYEGEKCSGMFHGLGQATFVGGNTYEGDFCDGLMHGHGIYTWKDGVVYSGDFLQNEITGCGIYKWPDGSAYEGEVSKGLRHGKGTFSHCDKQHSYCGEWARGKINGKGRMNYDGDSNSFYEGDWVDGVKQGCGVRLYPSGNTYEGQYSANLRHGAGKMCWVNRNEAYVGDWVNGVQHGSGQYFWYLYRGTSSQYPTHNTYHGQFCRGVRHGCGTFYYANGARYEGEWVNNLKWGKGKFVFKNGRVYEGCFENDHIVEFPGFVMDGVCTPDLSKIRTRTPLPMERSSVMSNASVNTYSPSFQLDVMYLLDGFDDADLDEECCQLVNAVLRHMTSLRRIYYFYARLGRACTPDNTYTLTQLQLSRLLKDCCLHAIHNFGLTHFNRWLARTPDRIEAMQDPNRPILFLEFVNHLVVIAFTTHPASRDSKSILATSFSQMMTENVLRSACVVRGHFLTETRRALYAVSHLCNAFNAYKTLCTPRKCCSDDRVLTMRQFLLILKDFDLLSKQLTAKKVLDVLACDDPKVSDDWGLVSLEHEMSFYDFFEALIGCAQIYVTPQLVAQMFAPEPELIMLDPSNYLPETGEGPDDVTPGDVTDAPRAEGSGEQGPRRSDDPEGRQSRTDSGARQSQARTSGPLAENDSAEAPDRSPSQSQAKGQKKSHSAKESKTNRNKSNASKGADAASTADPQTKAAPSAAQVPRVSPSIDKSSRKQSVSPDQTAARPSSKAFTPEGLAQGQGRKKSVAPGGPEPGVGEGHGKSMRGSELKEEAEETQEARESAAEGDPAVDASAEQPLEPLQVCAEPEAKLEKEEEEEPIDEETQQFNFWTHQIHIFFVCKFFPAVERHQTIQCMIKQYEQAIKDGC